MTAFGKVASVVEELLPAARRAFSATARGVGRIGAEVAGVTPEMIRRHPIASALTAAGGVTAGRHLISEHLGGGATIEEAVAGLEEDRHAAMAAYLTSKRRQYDMAASMARLAVNNPELYTQIAFARRLPRGATVLGGQPNYDFLEMVAQKMAAGEFGGAKVQARTGGRGDEITMTAGQPLF